MPPSAYLLFVRNTRSAVVGSASEAAKQLSATWCALPPHVKAAYEDEAKKMKDRHARDLLAFKKELWLRSTAKHNRSAEDAWAAGDRSPSDETESK